MPGRKIEGEARANNYTLYDSANLRQQEKLLGISKEIIKAYLFSRVES